MSYQPSLQTHFNARIDLATLEQIRAFGFQWARIDCQTSDLDTITGMIDDADQAALHPLPIVYDLDRLEVLGVNPAVVDVEWGNEPDGDIAPSTYRTQLERACELAAYFHLRLWAPALSNLDRDSLFWLERVRGTGWPPGLHGISVHRYGDGTFAWAHDGFASRADEVAALLRLCDGKPFIVTEFGYPTGSVRTEGRGPQTRRRYLQPDLTLTEAQAAANIAREWDFWRAYTEVPCLYQINDGPNPGETYGIRRYPWDLNQWKPAAYGVPQEEPPMPDTGDATYCISRRNSIEMPGRPGEYHTFYPKGQTGTVLSVREDGHFAAIPVGEAGAFETWKPSTDGNRAVFYETAEIYAIPLVD